MKYPFAIIFVIYAALIMVNSAFFFIDAKPAQAISGTLEVVGTVKEEPFRSDAGVSFLLESLVSRKKYIAFVCSPDAEISYGDVVRIKGKYSTSSQLNNPGQFDYFDYLKRKGISGSISAFRKKDFLVLAKEKGNPFVSFAVKMKNRVASAFLSMMPPDYSSLLGSIVFGTKASPVTDDVKSKYQKAGVVHVLVASGQQVSILIGVCFAAGKISGAPVNVTAAFTSVLIWLFSAMAGFCPSIIRSSVMGQIMIAGTFFEREGEFYNSLSFAAIVLLIMNPNNLFDIGVQLSFLATWALVYIAPVIKDVLSAYINKSIALAVSVAVAPVAATMPVCVYYFSTLSFVAVFSNLFIVPLAECITTAGFMCAALSFVFYPAAWVIGKFLVGLLFLLGTIVDFFSSLPFACAYVESPGPTFIFLYFGALIYTVDAIKRKGLQHVLDIKKNALILAGILLVLWLGFSRPMSASRDLTVTVLDVGQGDTIFIRTPDDHKILIDGGVAKMGKAVVLPFLQRNGINDIDLLVLTHPHDDHVGGLCDVVGSIKVKQVLDSGVPHTSPFYRRFLELIMKNKIKYAMGRYGQKFTFGDVSAFVLAPFNDLSGSDLNNNSIVMKFVYGNNSFLFMGDASFDEESQMLGKGINVSSNVLKVGHHGSTYSSSDDFIDSVRPKIAVIPVGRNNVYGHPSPYTIEKLLDRGIKVFRTDIDGAVILKSDGSHIEVSSAAGSLP
ncbi:MAG: DNA internalization-related competence protein ComEC/Rec2 [Candidatus Margulisiibacteriota bacterium]